MLNRLFNNTITRSLLVAELLLLAVTLTGCSNQADKQSYGDMVDGDQENSDTEEGDTADGDTADGDHPTDGDDPAPGLTRLRADGTRIVDSSGETVVLKGFNLGGWLFNETWITQIDYSLRSRIYALGQKEGIGETITETLLEVGYDHGAPDYLDRITAALASRIGDEAAQNFRALINTYLPTVDDDSDLPLRLKLAERFGDETRDELLDIFQEAWINESDIAWIAEQGFNVVRVPISYRNLVTGPDMDKPTNLIWNERTWERVSRLLDWCETYRIYAVLDIQESPGGHNGYSGEAYLYSDPAMQALTVRLWEEFSKHYGDRDVVAAYSLLAEPFGAPDAQTRDSVYDLLVGAIRALGDEHLLVIHDGFLGMNTMPEPEKMSWENVLYSTHIFEFSAQSYEDFYFLVEYYHGPAFKKAQERCKVPFYIGSFSTRADADWAYQAAELLVSWYTEQGWSWSLWTYKRIDDPIDVQLWNKRSSYGVIGRLNGEFSRPDVFDDDLETLRARMASYRDLDLSPNERLLEVLRAGL
jgi:aryl-phospho-beta-D-glucosidase BglC (GH1 family)